MKTPKFSSTDHLLLTLLAQADDQSLWLADENALGLLETGTDKLPNCITNRFDIHRLAQTRCEQAWFSDWDLAPCFETRQYQQVIFRISKEKPVNHHVINQLAALLTPGSSIVLLGQKNEGIKSLGDNAGTLFGNKKINKIGNDYTVTLQVNQPTEARLDSQNYTEMRPIAEWQQHTIHSKPGTFGWQKIDEGSAFLLTQLESLAPQLATPSRILDLGCGYGFLTLGAKKLCQNNWPNARWLATDNCAAALLACEKNCSDWADIFAGDKGLDEQGKPARDAVDFILCNPPFHQGFSPSGDITEKFLHAIKRWLLPQGHALIVVNQFVGIEKRAKGLFKSCKTLADNGSFKVMQLIGY